MLLDDFEGFLAEVEGLFVDELAGGGAGADGRGVDLVGQTIVFPIES